MMRMLRYAAAALAVLLLLAALPACSGESEVPKGYQYATCAGRVHRIRYVLPIGFRKHITRIMNI